MKAVPGGHNLFIQVRNWFSILEVFTFVHVLTFLIRHFCRDGKNM